jgi:transcriptional regulator with XRE-family HTH domain
MTTSGSLIREARLRAGLTQAELAELSGRDRTQIARWERDAVQPSFETLLELLRACGFGLPLELVPMERAPSAVIEETARLTPQERFDRARELYSEEGDPRAVLQALEQAHVTYVVIGGLARVLHGTDEPVAGIEICPHPDRGNIGRLSATLRDGAGVDTDPDDLGTAGRTELSTAHGQMTITLEPEGTRGGYQDLRLHATREALGGGLRAPVASALDCARMLAALGRETDQARLNELRQLVELERSLGIEL